MRSNVVVAALTAAVLTAALAGAPDPESFHFIILGDRTGEAHPGVYEQAWRESAAEAPSFVVTVGDTIEGLNDATAETEWRQVRKMLAPFERYPLYLAPGNHDIWSDRSESLFRKYATHPPHYSFDYRQAHFTILDNSRSDQLSSNELAFLEKDLQAHQAQTLKFIVFHRPSWLLNAVFQNPHFKLHQLAKKYGVRYVIAGHLHQMLHIDLDGVAYLSMPSSGGHLRGSEKYEDGWFFGYTRVDVRGQDVSFKIQELGAPYGQGRATAITDWGIHGLVKSGLIEKTAAGASN